MFTVIAYINDRPDNHYNQHTFGPFLTRDMAEHVVTILANRENVLSAKVVAE